MPVDPRVAQMVAQRAGRPMPPQGRPPRGMPPQGMPTQAAVRPMPPRGMPPKGMPLRAAVRPMPPQGTPPQPNQPGMPPPFRMGEDGRGLPPLMPDSPQYKKGGSVKNLFKGKESMSEELKEAKAIKSGKITPMQYAKGEKSEDKKKGKPFAKGGSVRGDGIAQRGKTKGRMC